ncbi:MAG: biopolymer transporter ExbD [Alphaproteobacteria bacterium]|nr:biopolymer transporter ExbD [Alphaproteobacteria bacterium]
MGMSVDQSAYGDDDDGGYRPMAEINITPFVDVMLVLLIIFMVAAPLMVAGVPVELPKTSAAKLNAPKKPVVVTMTADGKFQIREEFVAPDRLVSRLISLRKAEGDTVVYLRADKSMAYGDVMTVLGRLGESGYGRLSLLSHKLPGGTPVSGGK